MKKIIGAYLLLHAAVKGFCMYLSLKSDESSLPVAVLALCVVLILGAVYVAVMAFLGKARLRLISRYFIVEILLSLFNIIYMFFESSEMLPTDSLVTGNLFDILVAGVIIFYLTRQKYYIRAKYVSAAQPEEDEESLPADEDVWPVI